VRSEKKKRRRRRRMMMMMSRNRARGVLFLVIN